ncbi:hypothetical protein LT493_25095 [Streptomyces tricolor]|nr:hypothetical protein [Streptomyces tricolor]
MNPDTGVPLWHAYTAQWIAGRTAARAGPGHHRHLVPGRHRQLSAWTAPYDLARVRHRLAGALLAEGGAASATGPVEICGWPRRSPTTSGPAPGRRRHRLAQQARLTLGRAARQAAIGRGARPLTSREPGRPRPGRGQPHPAAR